MPTALSQLRQMSETVNRLETENRNLREQIARKNEVLSEFADPDNWGKVTDDEVGDYPVWITLDTDPIKLAKEGLE